MNFIANLLLLLTIIWMCCVLIACIILWFNGKESHKKERVDLYWFWFDRFGKIGISFPRCFVPLFNLFQKRKVGFGFLAASIIVKNKDGSLLLCEITQKKRYKNVKYDIGAGGGVTAGEDPTVSAVREIDEEIGIVVKKDRLKYLRTVTPSSGYHWIVSQYSLELNDNEEVNLQRSDGTYIRTLWISVQDLKRKYSDGVVKADQFLNATTNTW